MADIQGPLVERTAGTQSLVGLWAGGLTQVDTMTSFRQFLTGPVLGRRMLLSVHVCIGTIYTCEHTFALAVPSAWNTFSTLPQIL